MLRIVDLLLVTLLASCSESPEPTQEPVAASDQVAAPAPKAAPPAAKIVAPAADDPCLILSKLPSDPPLVLGGKNVVLTKVMKPCVSRDGRRGYEKTSPYLAMGFPCTGGSGRIEIKGHYNNPHMISFLLGTDCAMAPGKDSVQQLLTSNYGLPATMKLAAYTPFVVQFWEVAGMADADVGYAIELRQAPAVEGLWHRFQQTEPIRVRLYGRENTWVQGENFYFVEADLRMTGRNAFQLQVVKVKPLTKAEVSEVRGRCEALRPKKNCTDVF